MIERKRRRYTARQSLGWCAAAIAVATAVGATGCSSNNSGGGNGTPGNFVRVGTLDSVQSFDFWTTDDTLLGDTAAIIYPLLVQYNLHTKSFEPDFATTWRTSSDGRTYTFTTRKHAEWSDGKPLTAADAAWMINTVVRLQNGSAAALASNVVGITHATATSPTSLTVTYSKPESDALANLTHLPILPEHVWGAMAAGKGTALRTAPVMPSAGHPVVSGGPFVFAKSSTTSQWCFCATPTTTGRRRTSAASASSFSPMTTRLSPPCRLTRWTPPWGTRTFRRPTCTR